ncbi:MAG: hypothetical protein JKY02_01970 [Flavobacteriaceae bacterium]|nr:hypothetical protein [Flavobacteriaceae bacterium]
MVFNGINNQTVEFRVTNYEFPNNTTCEYDSNWLLIYLKVKSSFGNWKTIDPSLLTTEVKIIIEWFENLSKNNVIENGLTFLEPNLEFQLMKNQSNCKHIRMLFDLESKPKNHEKDKEYYVDFEFSINQLNKVVEDLKNELKPYPIRALYSL